MDLKSSGKFFACKRIELCSLFKFHAPKNWNSTFSVSFKTSTENKVIVPEMTNFHILNNVNNNVKIIQYQ